MIALFGYTLVYIWTIANSLLTYWSQPGVGNEREGKRTPYSDDNLRQPWSQTPHPTRLKFSRKESPCVSPDQSIRLRKIDLVPFWYGTVTERLFCPKVNEFSKCFSTTCLTFFEERRSSMIYPCKYLDCKGYNAPFRTNDLQVILTCVWLSFVIF